MGQKWDEFYRPLCYTGSVRAPGQGGLVGGKSRGGGQAEGSLGKVLVRGKGGKGPAENYTPHSRANARNRGRAPTMVS